MATWVIKGASCTMMGTVTASEMARKYWKTPSQSGFRKYGGMTMRASAPRLSASRLRATATSVPVWPVLTTRGTRPSTSRTMACSRVRRSSEPRV
ncbi:MAG TPA: hypothetical protein VGN09_11710 [Vicinamibacteria bacterium]|jgi:hypothetical protein